MRMSLQRRMAALLLRFIEQLPASMLITGILILVSPDQTGAQQAFAALCLVLCGAFTLISVIAQAVFHRMDDEGDAQQ